MAKTCRSIFYLVWIVCFVQCQIGTVEVLSPYDSRIIPSDDQHVLSHDSALIEKDVIYPPGDGLAILDGSLEFDQTSPKTDSSVVVTPECKRLTSASTVVSVESLTKL